MLLGLNISTGIPLSFIALAVYGISVAGLIRFFRYLRGGELLRILANPVFVLPLLFLLLLFNINPIGYQSFEWDEFASWLYWGKELYLTNSLNAVDLSWRQLGYPQAWPLALVLPQLLYDHFEPMRSLSVGIVWHAAALGIIYEIFVTYFRQKDWASPLVVSLAGYSFIFFLLAAEALRKLVPQDFLIELPQIFLLSSIFALFCLAGLGTERLRELSFTVGVMLAAGTMIKISVIAAVPAAAVMVVYSSLGEKSGLSGNQRLAHSAVNLGLFLLPVALVQAGWIDHAGQFQSDLSNLDSSFDFTADHLALAARLGDVAWAYIEFWKMPLTLMSAMGLAYAAGKKEFRPVVIGLLLFFIAYGAGLFQLYAFRFGPIEVAELQSHQRYLRVPLRIMHILGIVFLATLLVSDVVGSTFDIKRYFRARGFIAAAVLAVAVGGGYQLYVVCQSLTDVRDRYSLSQERLAVITELQRDRQALEPILTKFGKSKPLVALIAQGDDGYSLRVVRFLALSNRKDEDRIKYHVLDSYTWSELPDRRGWRPVTTAHKLTVTLGTADIIWGHRRDPWIDSVFKNFTAGCREGAPWRFLVKQGGGHKYRCIP